MFNDFPAALYGTFEQQAMMAFSMNQQLQSEIYDPIKLAAQTAYEVYHYDSDMELYQQREPSPINDEETLDGGIEEEISSVQTVKGRYMCPRPNCSKLYKNRNGLKYHLQKGSCQLASPATVLLPDGTTTSVSLQDLDASPLKKGIIIHSNDPDEIKKMKPFWCRKCSKRYKNLNGLKYHARVEHPELEFDRIRGVSKD